METIIEENSYELKVIDEFLSYCDEDEDEGELCEEFEEDSSQLLQPHELTDYASDIRFDLTQLLSQVQIRESRWYSRCALQLTRPKSRRITYKGVRSWCWKRRTEGHIETETEGWAAGMVSRVNSGAGARAVLPKAGAPLLSAGGGLA